MYQVFQDAGIFAWPLAFCSASAVFIIIERMIALRRSKVIPSKVRECFVQGTVPDEGDDRSVIGRILMFYYNHDVDDEQLKAFARLQISGMERGLFVLEVVIGAAPLIGLLGTVTGLIKVFSKITPETGLPDTGAFVEGVAMALTTTMLGLSIAIPALVFNSYLGRVIDSYAAQIGVGVERLVALKKNQKRR